jgi:hypothetical protein
MNVIVAGGLLLMLSGQVTNSDVSGASLHQAHPQPDLRIEGKALKDTPDAVLQRVLAEPDTASEMRYGIRSEIALRREWRSHRSLEDYTLWHP